MKARRHISDLFPRVSIPESVVRNAMAKMRMDENDASEFVLALRNQKRRGNCRISEYYS